MAKVAPIQGNFNGGEFSELVHGRVDSDRYGTGLAECKNWIPTIQGGLTRRSGTEFICEITDLVYGPSSVQEFKFSNTQKYAIIFFVDNLGVTKIGFIKDRAQVLKSGNWYVVDQHDGGENLPYGATDLIDLKFSQSGDVLYITHPILHLSIRSKP